MQKSLTDNFKPVYDAQLFTTQRILSRLGPGYVIVIHVKLNRLVYLV